MATSWLMKPKSSGPVISPSVFAAQSRQRYSGSIAGRNFFPASYTSSARISSMSSRQLVNMIQVSIGNRSKLTFRHLANFGNNLGNNYA